MAVACITSLALLDARNLPLGEWYAVLDRGSDTPHLIWTGHLEIRDSAPEG